MKQDPIPRNPPKPPKCVNCGLHQGFAGMHTRTCQCPDYLINLNKTIKIEKPNGLYRKYKMSNLEIQKYIEDNLRNCQDGEMMDEQVFYEGAKWYRDYHKEKLATNEDTKEGNIFQLIREELDDWVFGVETQAGVKLKIVDSADFNEIIINIRDKSKT